MSKRNLLYRREPNGIEITKDGYHDIYLRAECLDNTIITISLRRKQQEVQLTTMYTQKGHIAQMQHASHLRKGDKILVKASQKNIFARVTAVHMQGLTHDVTVIEKVVKAYVEVSK